MIRQIITGSKALTESITAVEAHTQARRIILPHHQEQSTATNIRQELQSCSFRHLEWAGRSLLA